MPLVEYEKHRFYDANEELLWFVNNIIKRYQRQGFVLTLRQLYYQLVAKNHLPNNKKFYGRLSALVAKGRLAGLIDWDAIVDMTRESCCNTHFDSVSDALDILSQQYAIDTRATQEDYVEVWVEKDALTGVIEPVCSELDVTFLSCRGFVSLSTLWDAVSRRLESATRRGQRVVILHLADHDPSGINMTEDIRNRLTTFMPSHPVKVKRIGLNIKQVQKYKLPPNPAKQDDRRYGEYHKRFGDECWELDALEPSIIQRIIRKHVERLTDADKRQVLMEQQRQEKSRLNRISEQMEK